MSHAMTNVSYSQSPERDLSRWQVREDDDDYGNAQLSKSVQELLDLITDRLIRADALTDLLRSAENPPEHATRITAMLLQDLIRETQEANEKLWEELRRLTRQLGDSATRH
jgi:hypothetical protein